MGPNNKFLNIGDRTANSSAITWNSTVCLSEPTSKMELARWSSFRRVRLLESMDLFASSILDCD